VTRKLKRFEIQQEENLRVTKKESQKSVSTAVAEDHLRFREGAGAVLAKLVRESKPDAGALDPSMNIELDLGFDSLARVELLGLAEARLGVHVDEHKAAGIFTLGELIDAFEAAKGGKGTGGISTANRSWKEILASGPEDASEAHYIFKPRRLVNPV